MYGEIPLPSAGYKSTVELNGDGNAIVNFAEPVRAITPGQAVVFYDGDECLGGGTIDTVIKNGKKLEYVG